MTSNATNLATAIAWLASASVGATIIWTGVIKAIAPHTFRRHLGSLGWIPTNLTRTAVTAAAAFEVGWGSALILGTFPRIVLPASIVLLLAFSLITWWSVKTGKVADCGCYGGYIQPSVGQSLGLNAAFASLIAISWALRPTESGLASWQVIVPAAAMVIAGAVAEWAQRYEFKTGTPRLTPSPLEEGAKWKHSWAHNLTRTTQGEMIVAMLGPDCPFCKQWVKVGNAMTQSPLLPAVFGVVGASEKRRDEFVAEYNIKFPVASISPSLMSRLAQAVPTTLLVEDGEIKRMWVGSMPADFVQRFRRAFFPDELIGSVKETIPDATTVG